MPCSWAEAINAVAVSALVVATFLYTGITAWSLKKMSRQNEILRASLIAQVRHSVLTLRGFYLASQRKGGWTEFEAELQKFEAFAEDLKPDLLRDKQ